MYDEKNIATWEGKTKKSGKKKAGEECKLSKFKMRQLLLWDKQLRTINSVLLHEDNN